MYPAGRCVVAALFVGSLAASAQAETVSFVVTSDSHYDFGENEDRNERNRATVAEINAVAERTWPDALGGGAIGEPRAVLVLGDVIDDGDRVRDGHNQSRQQYEVFLRDFGLTGAEGLLKYPAFEAIGNHDGPPIGREKHGFSFQAQLKERNARRLALGLIDVVSPGGLHYGWRWGDVHFVQLNLYPGDAPHPQTKYNPAYHDPQQSLTFLRNYLAEHVGASGRPVVILQHYDLQGSDWWHQQERVAFYDAVLPYRVAAVFHGHTGTDVYRWKPDGAERELTVINTGQTENGFFVVEIDLHELRLAYRVKEGVRVTREERRELRTWDGAWGWKLLLRQPIEVPAAPAEVGS